MDDLLIRLADILDMSVEAITAYYPVLKTQMIWYTILEASYEIALFILIFGGLTLAVTIPLMIVECGEIVHKKVMAILAVIVIMGLITVSVAPILLSVLSTDLLLLDKLL